MADDWTWTFLGFESGAEGHPVQAWYDALCVEDREMLLDTLVYLERQTNRRWPEKMYNPLDGAGGISEIRIPEFRGIRNGNFRGLLSASTDSSALSVIKGRIPFYMGQIRR